MGGNPEGLKVHDDDGTWEVVRLVDTDNPDLKKAFVKKPGLPNPPEAVWQELMESLEGGSDIIIV